MASLGLFVLALCVFGAAVVSASSNHACCSAPSKGWAASGSCTLAKCNQAMQFSSDAHLIEFLDGCRAHFSLDYVFSTMSCAAPLLSRSYYMDMIYGEQAPPSQYASRTMRGRIAGFVLGYGCLRNSTTTPCLKLQTEQFANKDALFGKVPAGFDSKTATTLTASLTSLVRNCLASTSDDFASSEFASGASRCAAVADASKPADFVGVVEKSLPSASSCPNCATSGTELPFCARHYNGGMGVRCSSREADRIAQSFYKQWTVTKVATINAVTINVTSTACKDLLYNVACETSLGLCNRTESSATRCQHVCQSSFQNDCRVSSTDAATVCSGLGAKDTASPCPSAAASSTTPASTTSAPSATTNKDLYQLRQATSGAKLTAFTITLCVRNGTQKSIESFLSQYYQDLCNNVSNHRCEIRNSTLTKGNTTCPVISTIEVTTTVPSGDAISVARTQSVKSRVENSFGAASVSMASSRVAQEFVTLKSTSSSASAAAVSLLSLLVVAVAAFILV